jgi:CubicO group peptidase (beta-lactamase class C family)
MALVVMLLASCAAPGAKPAKLDAKSWTQFKAELESLRQEMKIPGMSAAVVKDGQLAWDKGIGFADGANGWMVNSLRHGDEVTSVAFSPNGTLLASASYEEMIYFWEIPR